jgi:hypothetical protein
MKGGLGKGFADGKLLQASRERPLDILHRGNVLSRRVSLGGVDIFTFPARGISPMGKRLPHVKKKGEFYVFFKYT